MVLLKISRCGITGVNCSDAAGSDSASFGDAMALLARNGTAAGWDAATGTPYANFQRAGKPVQMWFDDVRSLRPKYAVSQELGLRGIGAYTLEGLDYSSTRSRNQSAEMWAALREASAVRQKTDDDFLREEANCTCADRSLCKPLPGPLPARIVMPIHGAPNVELEPTPAKFWGEDWRWDLTTTVGWGTGTQDDICFAHAQGVRVVGCIGVSIVPHTSPSTPFCPSGGAACPGNPTQDEWSAMLTNASARSEFVAGQYQNAPLGLDGWSIDVEGSKSHGRELTLLLRELRSVGQATNPDIQLSFFLPWHPGSDDYPWWTEAFDLPGLTEVNDYLVTMSCE